MRNNNNKSRTTDCLTSKRPERRAAPRKPNKCCSDGHTTGPSKSRRQHEEITHPAVPSTVQQFNKKRCSSAPIDAKPYRSTWGRTICPVGFGPGVPSNRLSSLPLYYFSCIAPHFLRPNESFMVSIRNCCNYCHR